MIYCEKDIPSCTVIIIHACFPLVIDKDLVIKRDYLEFLVYFGHFAYNNQRFYPQFSFLATSFIPDLSIYSYFHGYLPVVCLSTVFRVLLATSSTFVYVK